jgi:glycine/D-amino acid oxidase-like deaminating enzyme/nitrite reductase/ring-hydroxylating ferredoxin subunit
MASSTLPLFPKLLQNETADVCVVGSGIAGLTTAYLLARDGYSVIVLDDGPLVSGETERTTAHLTHALDSRFFELERLHGEKGARIAAESHSAAIEKIEEIVKRENIGCDYQRLDGYLFCPPGESTQILEREMAAAHRAGLDAVEMVSRAPVGSFDTGPALRFPRQAQFHPLKYLAALTIAFQRQGGRIFTNTHVTGVEGGEPARVETKGGYVVNAKALVMATNTPVNDRLIIHTKQAAYRTYVIGATVPAGSVPKGLYWDTADPYHYVRVQPLDRGDVLIIGGEDHKTGQANDADARYLRLEQWARARFPMIEAIPHRWSGQVMEPVDGLAFIGRNPMDQENVYLITGHSGNGMTYGTLAGMLISDLIAGRENRWAALYDPTRKTLGAAKEFAAQNLNVAARYLENVTGGIPQDPSTLLPGTGAVIRRGLKKAAVYRDDAGELHEFSAVCPHLSCLLSWNAAEKSWDCPCHGSRFDRHGHVLNGPAISDLED